ncbi:pilus assembly protein PilZ [Methylobacterium phyllosphaerae]|uniref:PilZ domain-containing protein n=1 Tax=Methylobacterium phyllosphaerae TaxID=418223 RepID=A0AAE8HP42_9HYPH|nr:PilZ domain-containing protein [Methylobacterium phyllosphaerae]APT32526.1 pilus assembly protein PilZ [Methylobacterium phyllosphaerae]SFG44641.1 PilZ domain-containing protein [Methylobacterium phyllosphaerae]
MSEHRREARQRVFLKGRIVFNNGSSSFDCLVRDMSSAGARLVMSDATTLPEAFDLYIPQKDRTYRAILRWRREDGIGVTFEQPASAAPASPVAAGTDASVTLLLKRVSELETENAALRRLLASMAQSADPASAA